MQATLMPSKRAPLQSRRKSFSLYPSRRFQEAPGEEGLQSFTPWQLEEGVLEKLAFLRQEIFEGKGSWRQLAQTPPAPVKGKEE